MKNSRRKYAWLPVVAIVCVAGCATPTPTEIHQQVDTARQTLEQVYQWRRAECNGNATCEQTVLDWYLDMQTKLLQLEAEALQENWRDAYQRRREWEDAIRKFAPGYFPKLSDVAPVGRETEISSYLTTTGFSAAAAALVDDTEWLCGSTVAGTLSLANSPFSVSVTLTGSLAFDGVTHPNGSIDAEVYAGSISAALTGGTEAHVGTFIVAPAVEGHPESGSSLHLNASGQGYINLVLTPMLASDAWNAIVPRYVRVKMPIVKYNGQLTLILADERLGDVMPNDTHFASDYNGNGILDHTADLAAFLAGLQLNEPKADVTCDNQWDQDDIDRWELEYTDDLNR